MQRLRSKEQSMKPTLISVLIITWDRKNDVLETVQSVYEQAYKNFEIIVVDNGSTDGTVDALRSAYPKVRVIPLSHNMGVAVGRNAGILRARGDIVLCLDSDASLGHETLTNLVHRFQSDPRLGVINSKVLNIYTQEIDKTAGWSYTEPNMADQNREFPSFTFSATGCAIRAEVFDRVGLFWELMFFGGEELEYSVRVWDAGYKIIYYPESIVYHRVSPHRRVTGAKRDCLEMTEMLYVYIVRYPWWMLLIFAPLKISATSVRATRQRYLRQMLGALLIVIKKIPALLKQRRPISNRIAYCYLRLQRQHGPLSWDLASWFKYKYNT